MKEHVLTFKMDSQVAHNIFRRATFHFPQSHMNHYLHVPMTQVSPPNILYET